MKTEEKTYRPVPLGAERLEASPALNDFVREIESILENGLGFENFRRCQAPMDGLVGSNFLRELVNQELDRMARRPEYLPPGSNLTSWLLLETEAFRLSVGLFSGLPEDQITANSPSTLQGPPEHLLLAILGPESVSLERYLQERPLPNEILARDRKLKRLPDLTLRPGSTACLEAMRDVYHILRPKDRTLALIFTSARVARFRWVYDRATLEPRLIAAADPGASRLEYAIQLLDEMDETEAGEALASLAEHPQHFVRWAAVKAAVRLQCPEGPDLLRRCLTDPHPHVRNAAEKSLRIIHPESETAPPGGTAA